MDFFYKLQCLYSWFHDVDVDIFIISCQIIPLSPVMNIIIVIIIFIIEVFLLLLLLLSLSLLSGGEEWAGDAEPAGDQAGWAHRSTGGPCGAAPDHQHPIQVTQYIPYSSTGGPCGAPLDHQHPIQVTQHIPYSTHRSHSWYRTGSTVPFKQETQYGRR